MPQSMINYSAPADAHCFSLQANRKALIQAVAHYAHADYRKAIWQVSNTVKRL